jgi:hypothetical protein
MILVYAPKITNRIKHACQLLLGDILGLTIKYTNEPEVFTGSDLPKLNYSNQRFGEEFTVFPAGLLSDTGIKEQELGVFKWEEMTCLYPTSEQSDLPFDPFSASFFLVTRYEEYLPHLSDVHNRFAAKDSVNYKHKFLQKPVVNIWAMKLKELLQKQYTGLHFKQQKYEFITTIDVDNAYAYREKGLIRTMGGFGKSLTKFNFSELGERSKVIIGGKQDPYDTYDYLLGIQKKYNLKSIYFFLLGDYGLNDKNVPVTSEKFQALIKSIADYAEVGIHPSYGSNSGKEQLQKEVRRLADITKREVTKSRQHFLRLIMPETYRRLIDLDIKDDYTMGFASEVGFRAGICTTYRHYDIDLEVATNLRVHPFALMEGTLNEYMEVSPEEALTLIEQLVNEVKAVNGTFISLWHNETVNDRHKWQGWRDVYEKMVQIAQP